MKLQLLDQVPHIQSIVVLSAEGKRLYQSKTKKQPISAQFRQITAELCEGFEFEDLEVIGATKWLYLRRIRNSDVLVIVASRELAAATLRLKCELAVS